MKKLTKVTIGALALVGAAMAGGTPAQAQGFAIGVGPGGGINFSYSSGGYCDSYGCPYGYWDMPVYYCPVYYRGRWHRGPVYYRHRHGRAQYWVRGGWHYDNWRGPRPDWACTDRFGPALGFSFYDRDPRFRVRNDWRQRWRRDHPHYRPGHDGPGWGDRPGDRRDRDGHRSGPNDRHDRPGYNNGPGRNDRDGHRSGPNDRRDRNGHNSGPGFKNNQPGHNAKPGGGTQPSAKPGKHDNNHAKPQNKGGNNKPDKKSDGHGGKKSDQHDKKHH